MILKGRKKIVSEFTSADLESNITKLIQFVNTTMPMHQYNSNEIDYLIRYYRGVQPVLDKTKSVREEINNKVVINNAQMITRNIIGYFLGTPIQYIQSGAYKKTQIDELNKYVSYEDKSSTDKEIGEYQSICGTAYRIIYTDGVFVDETPFEDRALNPSTTYVVYENNISEKPCAGITYFTLLNDDGSVKGTKLYVYLENGMYTCILDENKILRTDSDITWTPYLIGTIPIIEYPNNQWRIGDWEMVLGLMDTINNFYSGRIDDIDQVVQSLLVFINADIDADTYDEMREKGVVLLKSKAGEQSKVDSISTTLDQNGMHSLSEELLALLTMLVGIPDRNNRAGGGGDTGQAVELRDGWADLEVVARNKELSFKKSEKQTLRVILAILKNKLNFDLSLMDIDIKFTRNKNNNLLVKTQAYQNLLATKTISPEDCLTIVDLVSDVNEYINRGKVFWKEQFAGIEQETTQPNTQENNSETSNSEVIDTNE